MKLKIVKFYILLVLIMVLTFPAFYFLSPSFSEINRIKTSSYDGEFLFYQSGDVELFSRFHRNENSGKLIIFLPDGPSKVDVAFESLMKESLLPSASLLFPDYRGTGKSERRKSTSFYDFSNYVEDLNTHIKKHDGSEIIIISHGFGTLVSQSFVSKHDTSITQIMISPHVDFQESARAAAMAIATHFEIKDSEKQVPLFYEMRGYHVDEEDVGFFGTSKILALMDHYKINFVDTNLAEVIFPEYILSKNIYTLEELSSINLPSATIGLTYDLYKTSQSFQYDVLSSKTYLIFGKNDSMNMSSFFTNKGVTKIFMIENSGFYPHIEQTENVIAIIKEIIDET